MLSIWDFLAVLTENGGKKYKKCPTEANETEPNEIWLDKKER